MDVVFDRRTVLRYPVTPGKSSRWPACRGRRPGRGPPRTFSRGDGVSENRPAVEDDIHAACLYSADASNLGRKRRRISRVRVQLAIGPSPSIRRANEWKLFVFPRSHCPGHGCIHEANWGTGASEFSLEVGTRHRSRSSMQCLCTIIILGEGRTSRLSPDIILSVYVLLDS